jgi:hypothetical protein
MLYLIDANVIIHAKDLYYPVDRVPEYWHWLLLHGGDGRLKTPLEIFEEISPGRDKNDPFYVWRKDAATAAALVLEEEAAPTTVQRVLDEGYGRNLTDDELITIGKDPFLVAYAIAKIDRIVVTAEVSRPSRKRQNRHVPDVCDDLGVKWIDPFEFIRVLDFKTGRRL